MCVSPSKPPRNSKPHYAQPYFMLQNKANQLTFSNLYSASPARDTKVQTVLDLLKESDLAIHALNAKMKTTGIEAEEKRLRKNANQRRKYAQLSHDKKEALLQKNRERYVENKKKEAKGSEIDCTRKANLQQTQIQEDNIIINGAANITNSGSEIDCTRKANLQQTQIQEDDIIINGASNITNSEERNQRIPSDTMSARDKAQISSYSSCEIGSCSLTAIEADCSRMPRFPFQKGFVSSFVDIWEKPIDHSSQCTPHPPESEGCEGNVEGGQILQKRLPRTKEVGS